MPSSRTSSRTNRSGKKRTSSSKVASRAGVRTGGAGKKAGKQKRAAKATRKKRTASPARRKRAASSARKKKSVPKKKAARKPKAVSTRKSEPRGSSRKAKASKKAGATSSASRSKRPAAVKPAHKGSQGKTPAPREEAKAAPIRIPYGEGAFVVHPKYGLGRVERIVDRHLTTRTVRCLEIRFPYQEMKLTIPVDQVENSGLRPPIGRRQITGVFKVLKGRATFDANRRSAKRVMDYRKRLSEGDPTSLAEAVRDLGRLSLRKALSYEERRILSTALRILSREVALARGREAEDVREEIERIVYR